ncbi:MAG: chromosomal replication initiator protein DnaA, partial [Chloroflexota bacterium]|nr:chromosomal replication initiator protein DnaA [Chloroflexota bacterium]
MNPKQVWQAVLGELEVRLTRPQFETWLKNTSLQSVQDGVATISVPTSFAQVTIEKKFEPEIQRSLSNILGRPMEVQVAVNGTAKPRAPQESQPEEVPVRREPSPIDPPPHSEFGMMGTPLNPRYTFD